MTYLHREISFEDEVCEYLAAHGWLYAAGDAIHYDRALALFRLMCWHGCRVSFQSMEALTKNHGASAGDVLLARLREQVNTRGTLDVLRHGVEMIGLRQKLPLRNSNPRWR